MAWCGGKSSIIVDDFALKCPRSRGCSIDFPLSRLITGRRCRFDPYPNIKRKSSELRRRTSWSGSGWGVQDASGISSISYILCTSLRSWAHGFQLANILDAFFTTMRKSSMKAWGPPPPVVPSSFLPKLRRAAPYQCVSAVGMPCLKLWRIITVQIFARKLALTSTAATAMRALWSHFWYKWKFLKRCKTI